ncbi:unnamed protein product [Victoria cruziana]
MFTLYEYDIFWAFLMISSVIPILAFIISGVLAPISEGPEKISSYESGIEPIEDSFFIHGAMSFDILGVYVFIEALIFVLIPVVGLVYAWRKGALEWS